MVRKGLIYRINACLTAALAGISGGGSLILFAVFLFSGSLSLADMGLEWGEALWMDIGLSIAFFLQHSGMVRRPFRQWLARFVPSEFDGAVYAIASGLLLSAVVVFWQGGVPVYVAPPGVFRWAFRSLFFISAAGFLWTGVSLKSFDPFGIGPILDSLRGKSPRRMPFTVRGPYSLIRHPLYLFSILMIWSCPDLTADRLMLNITWTLWIIVGAHFEERDLVREFGDAYREYRRSVPMFLPRLNK
jgi:protein-S-isoprenylcysteine O-methyltransferase Ste14